MIWLFSLLALVLALVQTSFFSWNFLLLLMVIATLHFSYKESLFLAFWAGFCFDLFSVGRWGQTSLFYLAASGLILFLKDNFSLNNPFLISFLTFIASLLFSFLTFGQIHLLESIFLCIFVLPFSLKSEKIKI